MKQSYNKNFKHGEKTPIKTFKIFFERKKKSKKENTEKQKQNEN
jgi:hypothetical protein